MYPASKKFMRAISSCAVHHFHVICFESQKGRSSVVEQRPFKPLVVVSIPTAPTNHLPDWSGLNKFARGQKGQIEGHRSGSGAVVFSGTGDNRICKPSSPTRKYDCSPSRPGFAAKRCKAHFYVFLGASPH